MKIAIAAGAFSLLATLALLTPTEAQGARNAAQHAATLQSLDVLRQAAASLAAGDSDGVDDELARAEEALSGRTRLDVHAAREALARSDLYAARQYITGALAENRLRR